MKASYCSSLENIDDLSREHKSLYKIWLHDCHKLLRDEESKRYLEKILKQSFLKKRAAAEYFLSVTFPGCTIPSWFQEQQPGNQIALKLFPKWQNQIRGFAICGLFRQPTVYPCHSIEFRFENDGISISYKSEVDCINALTQADDVNMWLGYIPFSFFRTMHLGDYIQHENWFHVTEGTLVITVGLNDYKAVRCGAHIVNKEDVESFQKTKPCVSYDWNLECIQSNQTIIIHDDKSDRFSDGFLVLNREKNSCLIYCFYPIAESPGRRMSYEISSVKKKVCSKICGNTVVFNISALL